MYRSWNSTKSPPENVTLFLACKHQNVRIVHLLSVLLLIGGVFEASLYFSGFWSISYKIELLNKYGFQKNEHKRASLTVYSRPWHKFWLVLQNLQLLFRHPWTIRVSLHCQRRFFLFQSNNGGRNKSNYVTRVMIIISNILLWHIGTFRQLWHKYRYQNFPNRHHPHHPHRMHWKTVEINYSWIIYGLFIIPGERIVTSARESTAQITKTTFIFILEWI